MKEKWQDSVSRYAADRGDTKCRIDGMDDIWIVHQGEYEPGDKIVFTTDTFPAFYIIRIDGAMDETYVYLTDRQVEYPVPFEKGNPFKMDKISYSLGSFIGERHYITMRLAREQENRNYRNLAKNVTDCHENQGCYPHVHANVETQGPIAPLFAARNVIDGILANTSHWPWPFQSWGIDRRDDAEITLEFGRPVDMEELRLCIRADFPHDSWWVQSKVSFSDGTDAIIKLEKCIKPQVFMIQKKAITWLRLSEFVKADDPSPFPALRQIEVYGANSGFTERCQLV